MAVSAPDAEALVRLRQIYETAGWVLVESTLADIPADLRWLYESGAVTLPQLAAMHERLGVASAADLAAAAREGRIAPLLGSEVEAAVAAALPAVRARVPRVALGRAFATAEPLLAELRALSSVRWAEPAGSLRRGEDLIGDIELVVSSDAPAEVIDRFLACVEGARSLHRSERQAFVIADRLQIGVRIVAPARAGAALLHATGSADHLDALRARAESRGWWLSSDGLASPAEGVLDAPFETEIYAALQLPPIPPEIRRSGREVEIAASHGLPAFVTRADIRGDLHMHTTWSDGRDSIEAMVQACRALGYEYLAITDHSPNSAASRSLSIAGAAEQAEEIARLRDEHPDITILHGCEVDILANGSLDFPDRVLERFDLVLASLHEHEGQTPDRLLARYLGAMQHPLVAGITHPTNRLVPGRKGYDLDYDRLFEAAAETGSIVEIDGAPGHLDLDGDLARRAVALGATVCIDSDSHRTDVLARQMALGVLLARRGWIEPNQVLNTRPIEEVRRVLAAKRAR